MDRRFLGLDALRGIAALMVVLQHALWYVGQAGAVGAASLLDYFDPGKFGVGLFFLASGFVIPASFNAGLGSFAIRRAFRILPVLWLSILFALLGALAAHHLPDALTILTNLLMIAEPLGEPLLLLPYWTLQWELAFYCICCLLFACRRLDSGPWLMRLALAAIACSFAAPMALYLVWLLMGSLVRLEAWRCLGIVALAAAGATVSQLGNGSWAMILGCMWLAVPAFFLFLRWDRPGRTFVTLGAISYPLYLFHPLVLDLLYRLAAPAPIILAMGFLGSLGVAMLIHRTVENPLIACGRRVTSTKPAAERAVPAASV